MKLVILAGANSIHTVKWANGLQNSGIQVYLISQHPLMHQLDPKVKYYEIKNQGLLGYFTMVPKVKKLLKKINPDVVNAHYASGYGTTARLIGFHPYLLSVWGSDIFLFPKKSFLHKYLIKKNLINADIVASTSYCMALETNSLTKLKKEIEITPFGVDEKVFFNNRVYQLNGFLNADKIIIGTIKSLKNVYGIDILIRSFAFLHQRLSNENSSLASMLHLRIVGGGEQLVELKQLVENLKLTDRIDFVGQVSHDQVPVELGKLDIYVALSRSESFGVAVLEANLNQCPVVVSNVGGLPELVINHQTGIIVEGENPKQAANALYNLITQPKLISTYGKNAQDHVVKNYTWTASLRKMITVLEKTRKEAK